MNEANIFWSRVRRLIKQKKTTQEETARVCGIPFRTLEGWMYKGIFPTIIDGCSLARALGVSVEYLVTGKDERERKNASRVKGARSLLDKAGLELDGIV